MYKWKINMTNGDSYVVKSSIRNNIAFMDDLFGISLNPVPKVNIVHYDLYEAKEKNTKVAIISNHVSSVEWY